MLTNKTALGALTLAYIVVGISVAMLLRDIDRPNLSIVVSLSVMMVTVAYCVLVSKRSN